MVFIEKHHIVFKSQGGLDFDLNYKYLSALEHRGDHGPHKNKEVDDYYKAQMERKLRDILVCDYYSVDELVDILKLKTKQADRAFKRIKRGANGIDRESVIFRLMGGKFYI